MKGDIKARANNKREDIRDFVGKLCLTADTDADAKMLRIIYRTLFGMVGEGEEYFVIVNPERPGELGYWTINDKEKK